MKKAVWAAAALAVVALVLVAIVKSRPVRHYALRRAIATVETQFGIRLNAEDLRYDLVAMRVELRNLEAAAVPGGGTPFFTARRVSAEFPWSVVFDDFAMKSLVIEDGRIHIVRAQDGRTNLPASRGPGGTPDALRLGSLMAHRLAIEVVDEGTRSALVLPAIDITLSGQAGRLYLREPGRVARGDVATRVRDVRGGVAFDGRTIGISNLAIRTEELTMALTGNVAVLVAEPRVELELKARGDAARLVRWAEFDGPLAGDVNVRGEIEGSFDALDVLVTLDSPRLQYGSLAVTNVEGKAAVSPEAVRVERLSTHVAGGRVDAAGAIPLSAGEARLNLTWTGVDIEALTMMLDASAVPRPTGRAGGSLIARGPPRELREWMAEGHVQVSGGATARDRVAVAGRINLGLQNGEWTLGAPQPLSIGGLGVRPTVGGRVEWDALERSTIGGLVELVRTDVRSIPALLRRVGVLTDDVPALDGSVQAQAIVSGRVGAPRVDLQAEADVADIAPLSAGIPHTAVHVELRSDLRTANIEASLRELPAFVKAAVDLRAPYAAKVEAIAPGVVLERALEGVALPAPITGTVSATAHAAGPLSRWREARVDVEIESLDARLGALPVRLASAARASLSGNVADVASLDLIAGEARVSAVGRLPLNEVPASRSASDALLITATGDVAQFLAAAAATRMVVLPEVTGSGPAAFLGRVTGSAERPRISADLELGPGTVRVADLPPVTNLSLRVHSDGTWVDLQDASAEWQGSTVRARGRAPIQLATGTAGAGTVTARLTSITPRVLEPFLDPETLAQLEGSVDATLELQSSSLELNDVSGEVRLDRMELRVADLPIAQREPTRVAIRDGFAQVEAWQWTGQGGSAGVQGRVRLADRTAALIADGRFDLRMLTPFTRAAGMTVAGTLEPRLSITGALDSPRIDGVAAITDAEMRLRDPRVIATDLDGRVVLTGTSAHLTSLSGTVNGGTLSGSGRVSSGPGGSLDASLGITAGRMALEFPEGLHSELNADLTVELDVPSSDAQPPTGKVSGSITVVRSAYREPIALVGEVLAALRTRRLAAGAATGEPSLVDRLALDVRVATEAADITVDNNIGRLALGADLRAIGTVAAPALSGRAQLAEGGQLFLGRNRYEITSGTIDFVSPVAIEPELNIAATTRVADEEIELTITGSAEQPEIDARSSSNPDTTQADVFSLLLTGRRLEEISGDEAEIVGEQALAFLSGDVLGFASRAVGLDVIRLGDVEESSRADASEVASKVDPTARLTFGKSVGRNVDVTFSQGLRDADAQTWILDYRPRRQLEFRFVSNDETLGSYELRHDVTFGGVSLSAGPVAPAERRRRQRVAAVTITGARAVPEDRLRRILDLDEGDAFDFAAWQQDRDRIEGLLRREDLCEARVRARVEGEQSVTLAYSIDEGLRCAIEITGYALAPDTTAAIRVAWSESVFDDFFIEEARAIVARGLARGGHPQPKIEASLRVESERKTLRIAVDPGPEVTTRAVRFEGVDASLDAALRDWVSTGPGAVQAFEDPPGFERAATAWLRTQGHLRARVGAGTPRIEGAEAIVPVTVDAGPAFTVARVGVEGTHAKTTEELIEAVGLAPGAPFDPTSVEAVRERIQAMYRRDGFSAARVDARTSIDEASRSVTVTLAVTEGPRQVLRDVQVSGNRAIDTDVITRALDLQAGEPVTVDDWLQARRRVFDTGLFRRADVTPEPLQPATPDAAELPMRARVVVQEWPALRLRYGFQVTEERPEGEVTGRDAVPGLSADITRRTLFGRAVTVGASLDYQRREQSGRGFLTSRTMFGLPIESSFLIERSRENLASVDLATHLTGASWEQRLRAWRDLRVSYSYRFERNRTFRTTTRPDDDFGFDVTIALAWLNASVAWDTRDNVADTTRGWLLSSSFDWAPAALGTDFRFVKNLAQAYYFRPWRGLVFVSAARVGLAAPLDEQDLVLSERYYAGGARTVRGVAEDSLGPRFALGDPAGGESLLVLNQEVRFPIYRWLRGVGFVDAGNVFAEASGIDPGDLVSTYGAGLRLATPFVLLRVDYGRLFSPRTGEPAGRWIFGIGQAF